MDSDQASTQQPITPPSSSHQSHVFLMLLGGLLLLATGFTGGYFFANSTKQTPMQNNQQVVDTTPIISPEISPTSNLNQTEEWVEYISKKLPTITLNAYTIKYPPTWKKDIKREEDTVDILTLTKNNHNLQITQGPMGGGMCIFEGELPNGPAADYRNMPFVQIESNIGSLRRIQAKSDTPNEVKFGFCANSISNKTTYGSPTQVGSISYTIPVSYDKEILAEMDKIIATLDDSSQ